MTNNNNNNNNNSARLTTLRSSAKDYPVFTPTCYQEMIQAESAVLISSGNVTSSSNSTQRRYSDDTATLKSNTVAMSATPLQLQIEGRSPHHVAMSDATGSETGGHACFNCYSSSGSSNVFPVAKSQDFAHLPVTSAQRARNSNNTSGINPIKAWFSPKSKKQQPPQPPQSHASGDGHMEEVLKLKQEMGEMGKKLTLIESYYSLANPRKPSPATLPPLQDFMHAVTEARVCVKQLCRRIQESSFVTTRQREEEGEAGVREEACINLESLLNLAFYQDFENIQFQPSGAYSILDPCVRCQAYYKTFLVANNATCEELLSYKELSPSPTGLNYSHSFDLFCEQKMSLLQLELGWDGPWPDDMVEAFFTAARSIWLVHLLAFSFHPIASIFRVGGKETNAQTKLGFDPKYMEDIIPPYKKTTKILPKVGNVGIKVMVMPGFFVGDQIIKCKVLRQ